MAGPFDHLHIKRRTAGTSNELSFDVLDAARSEDGSRKSRAIRVPTGPKPSQGSYHGVGSSSTLSAVPEVERRKRARRNQAIRFWTVSVVVIVALAALAAFAGYRFYQDRVDYASRFDALIGRFVAIDKTLVEVDALMTDPLNSVEADKRKRVLAAFPDMESALEATLADAHALADDPVSPTDPTALSAVESAAVARKDMLASAEGAFKLSEIVNKHVDAANKAWNEVLAGDSAAREATKLANAATTEQATLAAREKTEEAIELMDAGKSDLDLLVREVPGLAFAAEIDYIDTRIESLNAGLQTADALLAGDRAAATAANEAYNATDREAASKAAALPSSVNDQVKSCYADEAARVIDAYGSARSRAATADSTLRSVA